MAQTLAIKGVRHAGSVIVNDWRRLAACRHVDADLFFPDGTTGEYVNGIAAAKRLCRVCPVIDSCFVFALVTKQEFGVWGARASLNGDT